MFTRAIIPNLTSWRADPLRKPLLLRGARQVGKSSVVRLFGQGFEYYAEINLENERHRLLLARATDLPSTIEAIELITGVPVRDDRTLVFIDEIQQLPAMITMLRFFYEERPSLAVIAAGSHLEASIKRAGLSVPVGRVDNQYLFPLTFDEHLSIFGFDKLLKLLRSVALGDPISDVLHTEAMGAFSSFMRWGGMPEIAAARLAGATPKRITTIYESLLSGFREDIFKYAREAEANDIAFVLNHAPHEVGSTFKYENFARGGRKSRDMHRAFDLLEQVLLLHQIRPTQAINPPLGEQPRRAKKLLFLDIGLVNYAAHLTESYQEGIKLTDLYRGRAADQVVGQELIALNTSRRPGLFYWCRHGSEGSAELDYTTTIDGKVIGIEVKSGASGKLRSLHQFALHAPEGRAIRIGDCKLAREQVTIGNTSYELISVPFYLVFRLPELLS